jgi:propionyl-CoA carboxylase beta chain
MTRSGCGLKPPDTRGSIAKRTGAAKMSADDRTELLRRMRLEALQSGGPERIADRRRRGKGTARGRVVRLLDPDTFVELDVFIEGVVTGHGKVNGRDVYVFSQDGELDELAGSMFGAKMVKVMDLAMKNGAPLVGLYDSGRAPGHVDGGSRSGSVPLGGYSELFFRNVMASGLVPQISAVLGPCAGSAAYSPLLSDFVIMVKGSGQLYLGSPADEAVDDEPEVGFEELGGARTHAEKSGVAHLAVTDEAECLELIRKLLSFLPGNNLEEAPRAAALDPVARRDEGLAALGTGEPYDMREVVRRVVDDGELLEMSPGWAENLVVGFARLAGRAVGVVGNQPAHLDGRLDLAGAAKGARFVRFCDAFNLPLVVFVDTPGFQGGIAQEHAGVLRSAAKMMYAFCEATVPKLTVVTRRAYGEGFEIMCSKHIRADFNFAWPSAEISAGSPLGALDRQDVASPYDAAVEGHLDDVIEPAETRSRLIAALEACASKREGRPPKKHGNIPL